MNSGTDNSLKCIHQHTYCASTDTHTHTHMQWFAKMCDLTVVCIPLSAGP